MKEEHIWTKKPETMLDWFCVVGACIALYLTLNNLGYFLGKIGVFIGIVSPFAGGIVIAYVLDPMVKFFYTKLFKEKKKTRGFAILLAYLVAILLLVLLAWLVIPQIVDSIAMLFTNFPSYIHSVQDMLGMAQERFGVDLSSATKVLDDSEAMVKEIYSMASAAMPQIVASIGSVASNFVAIFTSIAASIYMLADKEHLLHQLRTLAHAFLPEKAAENTLRICHYANVNFTGFFVGKIIDSAIIGVITFVAMAILRLDFALLISVFIGITNIIPVFGPFIGAIPSIFILLWLTDPGGHLRRADSGHPAGGRQLHRPEDPGLVHRHLCLVDPVFHRGRRRPVRSCGHGRRRAALCDLLRPGAGICALYAGQARAGQRGKPRW